MTKKLLAALLFATFFVSTSSHADFAIAKEPASANAVMTQEADTEQVNTIDIDSPNAVAEYASKAGVTMAEAARFIASLRAANHGPGGDIGIQTIGGHYSAYDPACYNPPAVQAYAIYDTSGGLHTITFLDAYNNAVGRGSGTCPTLQCRWVSFMSIPQYVDVSFYLVQINVPGWSFEYNHYCVYAT